MKRIPILGILFLLLLSGCGNSFRVYHDIDPTASFDSYKTYSFLDWTEGNKKTITGIELNRIRNEFALELEKRGLVYQPENADIKVKITVYFREARQPGYGWYYPGTYNYVERALSVDVFDGATKQHVWHSAAVGEVAQSPEKRAEDLPKQVQKMFEYYPAG